jgi:hypothetical protein
LQKARPGSQVKPVPLSEDNATAFSAAAKP